MATNLRLCGAEGFSIGVGLGLASPLLVRSSFILSWENMLHCVLLCVQWTSLKIKLQKEHPAKRPQLIKHRLPLVSTKKMANRLQKLVKLRRIFEGLYLISLTRCIGLTSMVTLMSESPRQRNEFQTQPSHLYFQTDTSLLCLQLISLQRWILCTTARWSGRVQRLVKTFMNVAEGSIVI